MLFNSFEFAVFFPVVVLVNFALAGRFRWAWLLAASLTFYMAWKPEYILLLLLSSSIDFLAGLKMSQLPSCEGRRPYLVLSLMGNFGLLFVFKYFNFFRDSLDAAFHAYGIGLTVPAMHLLLPVGISFYTFQAVSYSIDVYRGQMTAERHYGKFLLYITYFPQLVAGPIERATNLLPQVRAHHSFDYGRATAGLRLMAWGLLKKVVIADRVARLVNTVYNAPYGQEGPVLTLATLFFAVQIYCDFSGYSDIAIGAAQIMGIDLMRNFDRPYLSRSVVEFWQRWHISLSTWFKDYLYIPLGGNRASRWRRSSNLLLVFGLSGLWHGANWTFVIWGLFHGVCVVLSHWTASARLKICVATGLSRRPRLHGLLRWAITFGFVNLGWILFRAHNLPDALHILSRLRRGWSEVVNPTGLLAQLAKQGLPAYDLAVGLGGVVVLAAAELMQGERRVTEVVAAQPLFLRWSMYYAVVLVIMVWGVFENSPFIYFQF